MSLDHYGMKTLARKEMHLKSPELIFKNLPCSSSAVHVPVAQVSTYALKSSLGQIHVRLWISQPANEAAVYIHSC